MKNRTKLILLMGLVLVILIAVILLPIYEWILIGTGWADSHRRLAWFAYIAVYTVATILVFPGTILTLTAGFLFGIPVGIAVVSVGSLSGASCAFFIGRFLAHDWAKNRMKRFQKFEKLEIATRHKGFLIVLLTRLSPLFPFNLLNYAFGLTAVRFRDYFFASWIGMTPAIALYVSIGSTTKNVTELASQGIQGQSAEKLLLIVGLIATLILAVIIMRLATKVLDRELIKKIERNPE
tara:strand:- start:1794 stop:2504 length:711 start_codon:yes stop_codon:yes gene_type:complete